MGGATVVCRVRARRPRAGGTSVTLTKGRSGTGEFEPKRDLKRQREQEEASPPPQESGGGPAGGAKPLSLSLSLSAAVAAATAAAPPPRTSSIRPVNDIPMI